MSMPVGEVGGVSPSAQPAPLPWTRPSVLVTAALLAYLWWGRSFLYEMATAANLVFALLAVLILLPLCAWAAIRRSKAALQRRLVLTALYVLFGAANIVSQRAASARFDAFHCQVRTGMSMRAVFAHIDDFYRRDPRRWLVVMVTRRAGTGDTHGDEPARLTWTSGNDLTPALIDSVAEKFSGEQHLQVMFRNHVGYLYFTIDLDSAGNVTAVSPIDGHAA